MMNKIKIQGNKIKVLEDYYSSDYLALVFLLLIINYSIDGKSSTVTLKKIAFVFDAVQKNVDSSKWSTLLSSPWEIPADLRRRIILAYQKQLVSISDSAANGIVFALTENGNKLVAQIEEFNLFTDLRLYIQESCKKVKLSELKNQDLIW